MGAMDTRPLTARQKAFVTEYRRGKAAAVRAGCPDTPAARVTACRWLQDPRIAALIEREDKKLTREVGTTRQRVIEGLLKAVDEARKASDPLLQILGWREIGRLCGHYPPAELKRDRLPKTNISRTRRRNWTRKQRSYTEMSDAELFDLAEG
jgi:phage terminase small subunit